MLFVEQIITWLQQLSPLGILAVVFFFAFIENIFPPSPSDVLLIFGGTLIGLGTIDFTSMLIASTLGSTLGFMLAYGLGRYFQHRLLQGTASRYLPVNAIERVSSWFQRYGYGVIIINRFLTGTRAVVSVFAGISKMDFAVTTLLCAASATVWNFLLLYLGKSFGKNWRSVMDYLAVYGEVVTASIIFLLLIFIVKYFWQKRKAVDAK
jgi:membrane protein DedA with SNARE-associated domain